ncbi:hypothetical protein GCM10007160_04020 [Litchfieldella qijiaojingensis]|uniref:Pvc16 N-terminal domain-containing protein n=1 Tax=Litchfieldella qijiaojingensis TaxID=980347 RepID=A0ABQ2YD77_9GAMM|nr:DUF4255 domain-containing protein [Halomonas qijiaojingensis]GGX79797.1 hypothetical protein GCM10007160_04020 [Halomonas qijiaojingensis]
MPLEQSRTAIGAVGELLRTRLTARTSAGSVDVGRPEVAAGSAGPKFNLFLYQIEIDGYLRNQALDEGQDAPLWLVLRYLITAYDDSQESDSVAAHELLGEGMLALQELNFMQPSVPALMDNPQSLKITFDSADVDLLSKIMQGSDERYRLSAAFQVRPVMIAPSQPPSYAPLVQTVGPPGNEGVEVIPSLGPTLTRVEPEKFEAGDTITVFGEELSSAVQELRVGDQGYGITAAPAGRVRTRIPADTELSPGSHVIVAVSLSASGRRIHSNAIVGTLMPTLVSAVPGALTPDVSGNLFGSLTLTGERLGGPDDSIFVAFYRDGAIQLMLEASGIATQDSLTATVGVDDALPPGRYRIILRTNGAQAMAMPEVNWS